MPLIIGIAGGTGSGKTTIAYNIKAALMNEESVAIIEMDSYYKDFSFIEEADRENINYDHPDSIDFGLLLGHLKALNEGRPIDKPIYDFCHHLRSKETERIASADIIILEGILAFHNKDVRDILNIKLFVDTDSDIRVFRRIRRDIEVRGRKFESIRKKYYETVKPMHAQFVEPSKKWADIVLPEGGNNIIAIDMIVSSIKRWLDNKKLFS